MLVLQRNPDQRIILDLTDYGIREQIAIMVTKVRGEKVWIGVQADRKVGIFREELLDGTAGHPR
jgi:sRNA-binding carbon storage regulator CsrA